MKNQLVSFYNIFEEKGDDVTYLNKDFDKIAVNFVSIEISCIKCCITFPSRLKLYNHLKRNCLEIFLSTFPTQVASSIFIIASKTIHQFFGLGLAFQGWTYTTTLITFILEYLLSDANSDSIAYLNTKCKVLPVDKTWLLKRLPIQKINTMLIPLRIKGIRSSKHKSKEYATLFLYFLSKNNID